MICNCIGCGKIAKYNVCVELRVNTKHKAAVSTPFIQVCEEHKKEGVKVEDLINDKGWLRICSAMIANGYQTPDRKLTTIVFQPIHN